MPNKRNKNKKTLTKLSQAVSKLLQMGTILLVYSTVYYYIPCFVVIKSLNGKIFIPSKKMNNKHPREAFNTKYLTAIIRKKLPLNDYIALRYEKFQRSASRMHAKAYSCRADILK